MQKKHQFLILIGVGIIAGMYCANSASGTGIYANKLVGQFAANVYVAGAKLGGGTAPALTTSN